MGRKKNTIAHLKRRVRINEESGCWEWTGTLNRTGYAIGKFDEKTQLMHRVFFVDDYDVTLTPDEQLDHLCRNRACVNPQHLEIVSAAENTRRGSRTKLTSQSVIALRERYLAGGVTQQQLADEHGVTVRTINGIIQGREWMTDMPRYEKQSFAHRRGELNTKLSSDDVATIRSRHKSESITFTQLGKEYGIHPSYIGRIVRGLFR